MSSVGSATITMSTSSTSCWGLRTQFRFGTPTAVENNYALLGTPGQFYIDRSAQEISYVPRAGENMSTATVVASQLQTLVSVTNASNLTFQGLTFEYGTWTFDGTGAVSGQGNSLFKY